TTLQARDLDDFLAKRESLSRLRPLEDLLQPLFLLLAYSSSVSPKTFAKWMAHTAAKDAPDLLCVISEALIGSGQDVLGVGTAGRLGRVLLQRRDEGGARTEEYVLATDRAQMKEVYEGRVYPVVSHAGDRYLADPGRALLLFVEGLLRLLGERGATRKSV